MSNTQRQKRGKGRTRKSALGSIQRGGGEARVGEGKEECNYGRGRKWKGGKEGDIHGGGKGS